MNFLQLLAGEPGLAQQAYEFGFAHLTLCKAAAGEPPSTSFALSGRLYASKSGWVLLSVPNAVIRGLFDAMDEPGIELPLKSDGTLNAHASVVRPEEIATIPGGIDAVIERGKAFRYTLGRFKTVEPLGWDEMSRVWMVHIHSPELQQFRRSYGLPSLPTKNGVELPFHITVAVRRRKVLQNNEISRAASDKNAELELAKSVQEDSRAQQLAGHDRPLLQPETPAVQGLWRERDHRLQALAEKLSSVLAGYGTETARLHTGASIESQELQCLQLLLGDPQGPEQESSRQPLFDVSGGEKVAGGVGGGFRPEALNCMGEAGQRLVDRAGVDNAVWDVSSRTSPIDFGWRDKDPDGLGEIDGNVGERNSQPIKAGSVGPSCANAAEKSRTPPQAVLKLACGADCGCNQAPYPAMSRCPGCGQLWHGPEGEFCPACRAKPQADDPEANDGYCPGCDQDLYKMALESQFLHALATTPPHFSPQQSLPENVLTHLQGVHSRGNELISQQEAAVRLGAPEDPAYTQGVAADRFLDALAGKPAVPLHPLDQAIRNVVG